MGALTHTRETASAEETRAIGVALGKLLQPGDFIGLIGDLGAGKTELARGIAEGAGVPKGEVASPTFAIVYPYRGRIPLYHADLYRLADEDELFATGFFDLTAAKDGAFVVEWLDRIPTAAPEERLVITLQPLSLDRRSIRFDAAGDRHVELLQSLTK
jgi:tRNA threonylcarbamoyladenosine biosynthesis protein TsaE